MTFYRVQNKKNIKQVNCETYATIRKQQKKFEVCQAIEYSVVNGINSNKIPL